ncbi:basigin (Ok blood group) [Phyllostomus discolor]|uniref:Basigin (Ok blood group) n=1 Tax=Phyllostomus discolor TaxID=89673 RepID=A0A834DW93_9CHIR|nr:basigin (Ok blood group) [Phyllostomus discolor]
MATMLVVVLGLALLGAKSGSRAESQILTSIDFDGSKTRLTCIFNGSDTEILGHRWMKGDVLLKEDELRSRTTQYDMSAMAPTQRALARPSSRCVCVTSLPPSGPSWASWPRCSCWSPSSSSMRNGGSRMTSWMMRTQALLH